MEHILNLQLTLKQTVECLLHDPIIARCGHGYTLFILPCGAVVADSLSNRNNDVFIVAGTVILEHTNALLVHVGSLGTATAVYRGEAGLAGVVRLAEGTAGTTAAGHVVRIHCTCFT